jgi:hypothetical protein
MVLRNGLRFELAERLLDLCGRELHRPLSFRLVSPAASSGGGRPTLVCSTYVRSCRAVCTLT